MKNRSEFRHVVGLRGNNSPVQTPVDNTKIYNHAAKFLFWVSVSFFILISPSLSTFSLIIAHVLVFGECSDSAHNKNVKYSFGQ